MYSISPGFQEYVEAEAFLNYLNHGTLVTKDEIQLGLLRCNADLVRIPLTTHDYLLGIADLRYFSPWSRCRNGSLFADGAMQWRGHAVCGRVRVVW